MKTNARFEMKVGLFVFVGLVLIALLMLNFSKGLTLLKPTYKVRVIMPNVSGLKPKAGVMISGVPIGSVVSTELSPEGTNVAIIVKILSSYKIHSDANFHVDALGFLGDQYLAISPTKNEAPLLRDGDTVIGQAPFNLQAAVRSTSELLGQAHQTMENLNEVISNANRTLFSQQTLSSFSETISNLQSVTANAKHTTEIVEGVFQSNSVPLAMTISNFNVASAKLNAMASELEATVSTNRGDLTAAVKDLRATAHNFNQISADLQSGKGLAGSLLKDEELKAQTTAMIANLNEFSRNLNEKGLWAMLWKPKRTGKDGSSR